MPFGATPVWPWRKSKKPTPVTRTGSETDWNDEVAVRCASNVARAAAIPGLNGLVSLAQSGSGISEMRVSDESARTM